MADAPPRSRASDQDLGAALHEVGNALTVVLGLLDAARETAPDGLDEAMHVLDFAALRVRRAHRIARRALGAEPPPTGPEQVGTLVVEATLGLRAEARNRGVEVACDVEDAATEFLVDAGDRLLQVVTNLLLNAIEVTEHGGMVRIVVTALDDTRILVSVSDGGPGIPEPDRARLFQRGVTSRAGGAGIGLAHAMTVSEEEGGALHLRPFELGTGAIFELTWPARGELVTVERPHASGRGSLRAPGSANGPSSTDRARLSAPSTLRARSLEGIATLVLEDDAAVIELLSTVLEARGARVVAVTNRDGLNNALETDRFHVALLDASPLGVDIGPWLDALRKRFPDLALILVSGAPDPGASAMKVGVTWIRKPFEIEEVVEVLRLSCRQGVKTIG